MIKYLSLFSGIGSFEKALENQEIPFELVGYCEIDKYASKAYSLIHKVSESLNLGDITKIDTSKLQKDLDLITYGFPCQDISLDGDQKGLFNEDGTPTRSGLFFEALRIINQTQPKIAIAENVKNLTSKKFKTQFELILNSLNQAGYNTYWKVLNAKDYGIPQNRERVFLISIRKDVDMKRFDFPEPFELTTKLKDLLETEVDEKYFLSETALKNMTIDLSKSGKHFIDIVGHSGSGGQRGYIHTTENGIGALSATDYKQPKQIIQVGNIVKTDSFGGNPQRGMVYYAEGISPALTTCQGGGLEPKIIQAVK